VSRARRASALVALALAGLAGCDAVVPWHAGGREYEDICGPTPDYCLGHNCVMSTSGYISYEDCCDSYFCNCDPKTREWEGLYCDAPPGGWEPDAGHDAGPDAAPAAPDAGPDAAPAAPDAS
jgi:hypothetical protein